MKKARILALLLAVIMIVAVGCGGGATGGGDTTGGGSTGGSTGGGATTGGGDTTGGGSVKFALVGPMTGAGAAMGQQLAGGSTIAIEDWIAEKGGLNGDEVKTEIFDDQGVANQALIVAEKIASDPGFLGIVGHVNSGCTLAALPTYKNAGMVQISGSSTNVDLPNQGFDFFRTITDDNGNMEQMLRLGVEGVGAKKINLAYENTDWGIGSRDVLMGFIEEKYPGQVEVVDEATFDPNQDKDLTAIITRFKANDADSVFFIGEYTACSIFLTQKATLDYYPNMIGCTSDLNQEVINIAGADAEGMYTLNPYYYNGGDSERAFNERYLKFTNGNEQAGEWGAHNHDAMLAWLKFFEWHGSNEATYDEVVAGLKEMPEFTGVTGKIKFAADGNVEDKPFSYVVVKDGEFVPYSW